MNGPAHRIPKAQAVIAACALLFHSVLFAEAPDTLWTGNGESVYNESCERLLSLPDGGFLLGSPTGYPEHHYMLIKTDSLGTMQWARVYGSRIQWEQELFGGLAVTTDDDPICE